MRYISHINFYCNKTNSDANPAHAAALLVALHGMHKNGLRLPVKLLHCFTSINADGAGMPQLIAIADAATRERGFDACWRWLLKVSMTIPLI